MNYENILKENQMTLDMVANIVKLDTSTLRMVIDRGEFDKYNARNGILNVNKMFWKRLKHILDLKCKNWTTKKRKQYLTVKWSELI